MSKQKALSIILAISIAGTLFSGFLTYQELFTTNAATCPTQTKLILGLPSCLYGFIMYLLLVLISFWGLQTKNEK